MRPLSKHSMQMREEERMNVIPFLKEIPRGLPSIMRIDDPVWMISFDSIQSPAIKRNYNIQANYFPTNLPVSP